MIKRINNNNPDFYKYMGKIFGSRKVQRDTADRFYDDKEKEWIVSLQKNIILAVVSVKDSVIKNVYAEDISVLSSVLKDIYHDVSEGIVPITYKEAYISAGYKICEERKKFMVIKGGMSGG